MVSIKDIASLSGFSTATVSRTLSHPDRVTEKTRQSVMSVVEQLGYQVNSAARNLRRGRADAVLAVVPDLGNPFFSQILRGLQDGLLAQGCSLLVLDSRGSEGFGRSFLSHLREGRADGLVCMDGMVSEAVRAEMTQSQLASRIVFACEWLADSAFPSVRSDNRGGMALLVEHLVSMGHRRIGYVHGPKGNILDHERHGGLVAALDEKGLRLAPEHAFEGGFDYPAGQRAAAALIGAKERPTAVICASDQIAIGLISTFAARGLRVPEDISVTGFDDIGPAGFFVPALTTIRQDRPMLGLLAARMVLGCIDAADTPQPPETQIVPVELIVRGTTAPPPSEPGAGRCSKTKPDG